MCNFINLSKIKIGSTVHFRSGGSAIIESIELSGLLPYKYIVAFKDCHIKFSYSESGAYNNKPTVFDIVKVDQPAVDWSTIRNNRTVKSKSGIYFCFVGLDTYDCDKIVVQDSLGQLSRFYKSDLELVDYEY